VETAIKSGLSAQMLMMDRQNFGLVTSNARATPGDSKNVCAIQPNRGWFE